MSLSEHALQAALNNHYQKVAFLELAHTRGLLRESENIAANWEAQWETQQRHFQGQLDTQRLTFEEKLQENFDSESDHLETQTELRKLLCAQRSLYDLEVKELSDLLEAELPNRAQVTELSRQVEELRHELAQPTRVQNKELTRQVEELSDLLIQETSLLLNSNDELTAVRAVLAAKTEEFNVLFQQCSTGFQQSTDDDVSLLLLAKYDDLLLGYNALVLKYDDVLLRCDGYENENKDLMQTRDELRELVKVTLQVAKQTVAKASGDSKRLATEVDQKHKALLKEAKQDYSRLVAKVSEDGKILAAEMEQVSQTDKNNRAVMDSLTKEALRVKVQTRVSQERMRATLESFCLKMTHRVETLAKVKKEALILDDLWSDLYGEDEFMFSGPQRQQESKTEFANLKRALSVQMDIDRALQEEMTKVKKLLKDEKNLNARIQVECLQRTRNVEDCSADLLEHADRLERELKLLNFMKDTTKSHGVRLVKGIETVCAYVDTKEKAKYNALKEKLNHMSTKLQAIIEWQSGQMGDAL